MKIHAHFKYALLAMTLSISTFSQAAPTEAERAKMLAQQTINLFSGYTKDKVIKYGALIHNVTEEDARKSYEENLKSNPEAISVDPKIALINTLKEQFKGNDLKLVQPVFEKQFKIQ